MKYYEDIVMAFSRIGYTPRDNQIKYCNDVLIQYLDEGKKYCVLNAPTGSGKSILGIVIADVLHSKVTKKKTIDEIDQKASFVIMGQNILAQQYFDTFMKDSDIYYKYLSIDDTQVSIKSNPLFLFRKGAGQYKCNFFSNIKNIEASAELCLRSFLKSNENHKSDFIENTNNEVCFNCEYYMTRRLEYYSQHLISNYSLFFIDRLYMSRLDNGHGQTYEKPNRTVCIFDEAHTINDIFVEHNTIHFSLEKLDNIYNDIKNNLPATYTGKLLWDIKTFTENLYLEKIHSGNYLYYLEKLHNIYSDIVSLIDGHIFYYEGNDEQNKCVMYVKYKNMSKKYFGLGCKIDDLLVYKYEHIFEYNKDHKDITIKPIFIGNMFEKLSCSDYTLFMSATITKEFLVKTLNLNEDEVGFVKLNPSFSKEAKKLIFLSLVTLNYTSLQDDKIIEKIQDQTKKIVEYHSSVNEKGIILVPSFYLTNKISKVLYNTHEYKVFEHIQGTTLSTILNQFKNYNGPAVLISPSLFEGISLDDDLSRYQIIIKAPYPSLAEKRMKYILTKYPNIYSFLTLLKIIQGSGRSIRNCNDYCTTYMIDKHIEKLWKSKLNIWKDEFYTLSNIKKKS